MFTIVMQQVKLSIDCSSQVASFILTDANNHSISNIICDSSDELLFRKLPQTLNFHHLSVSDINDIAWGQGPGSFTGIRICASWLQSLAYIHNIKVKPICSLRARAQEYIEVNNISNGSFNSFLTANRLYAYYGRWVINNGFIESIQDVSVVNKKSLDDSVVDLGDYEPTALNIDKLSRGSFKHDSDLVGAFDIRPNYLFDHFN